jgi:hypothetical protein
VEQRLTENIKPLIDFAAKASESSVDPVKDYKNFIMSLARDFSTDVFSEQFITNFNILPQSKVAIVDGKVFQPEMFGFASHVPEEKNYIFFYVVPESMKSNHIRRIMLCNHREAESDAPCGHIRTEFGKFFDHLRAHGHERPFTCPYASCQQTFSFKENLKRHMHSHMGIKRFQCSTCQQLFSNNQNLKKHMSKAHC